MQTMFSTSVAQLTTQLTRLGVTRGVNTISVAATVANRGFSRYGTIHAQHLITPLSITPWYGATRGFARSTKNDGPKKKKDSTAIETKVDDSSSQGPQPFLQHQEWVKFQQSIRVDGFQTGQLTTATTLKKNRGGKQARNRKTRELALLQQGDPKFADSTDKFPAIRYSPEETQELLKLAFETLPKRTGRRGTRNLKRQNRRWKLVRDIRSKYKRQIIAAHERRMKHRHWVREQTKAVKAAAPAICEKDTQYQAQVLRRWAATMFSKASTEENEKNVVSVKE